MRWIRFAVFILIATVLQASLVDVIAVTTLNIKPDLLLIALVFFAIYSSTTEAVLTSFVTGFASDIISTSPMGAQIISYVIFGTLLAYLHRLVAIRKMPYQAAAIFVIGMCVLLSSYFLNSLRGQETITNIYKTAFGTSLYSCVIGPFFFLPCAWWMRLKTYRFSRH